ncbi:MAG: tetratricopeptide repeat protein [Flavobacteriales bacterium]|nr:tetratricopeptide repeat protein [Flavobacteriales bacterium]
MCCFSFDAKSNSLDSLLKLESSLPNDTNKIKVLMEISDIYIEVSFVKTIKYSKQALRISNLLGYDDGVLESLLSLANAYDYIGRYSESQEMNFKILAIYEADNNIVGMNNTFNNIGIIHYYLGNYKQAIEFTEKALSYFIAENDSNGMSICYNNLANSYSDELDYDKALVFYFKALAIDEANNDLGGVSLIKGNIGEVYIEQEKYDDAFIYLISALQAAEKTKDEWQQANVFAALGDLLSRQNKLYEAISFLLQALEINETIGAKAETGEIYNAISKVFEQKGDYIQSLHYIKLKNEINDELFSEESSGQIAEMNALYEISEKEKEILKQEAFASLQQTQKTALIVGSLIGFLLLFIIVGISVKGNLNKRKTNQTLELQKQQIETKNRDITDSIQYAKRIQGAILPSDKFIKKHLKESFVLYLPKDIVAGDFYWMDTKGDDILFAAADCTGHGVPGAMVSVVCHNALNRAVREFGLSEPAKILDKVTELVIETFEQSDANIKDGMDIALCSLNTATNELQYSGANNSLYIIQDNELIETKSDKQPIGKYMNIKPFTNHKQILNKEDKIYLFTDGYADQFGGEKGKKFKYKPFKELLLKNSNRSMKEQLDGLANSFNNWKGDLEQIDDVCVIGVRI